MNNLILKNCASLLTAAMLLLLLNVVSVRAQSVYGVSTRRTVVSNGSTTVVRKTTVVAGAHPAMCAGCIGVLPVGYRAVVVHGGHYFMVGGIYYRPQFYQGRTVYIRVHI